MQQGARANTNDSGQKSDDGHRLAQRNRQPEVQPFDAITEHAANAIRNGVDNWWREGAGDNVLKTTLPSQDAAPGIGQHNLAKGPSEPATLRTREGQ